MAGDLLSVLLARQMNKMVHLSHSQGTICHNLSLAIDVGNIDDISYLSEETCDDKYDDGEDAPYTAQPPNMRKN